ncbi:MAG: 50S ribosomal protein L18 [Beijerinckiaceae bacterium]|nr:50S ribosomal protein L18 [Beijerinckiaceae bacterium]MCI0737146.1 50S ribosomal protein L18 [Beijerinckiaceae bacterium]
MAKDRRATSRRLARVRRALRSHAYGKPRLTVFRSSRQIYCQIIDDSLGRTLAAASSLEKANRGSLKSGATVESAKSIGLQVAARAAQAGINEVVFDRGAYRYHGRVKALAEGAREGGLRF